MRLVELFLKETSMEDRAIISLAKAIYDYIDKKYNFGAAADPSPLTERSPFDFSQDDYDDDTDDHFGDIEEPAELEHNVGTVGDLFNTPLDILNQVNIILTTEEGMKKKSRDFDTNSKNEDGSVGMWVAATDDLILNMDYLGTNTLKSVIAHELRHALDDYKSDFKTSDFERKYNKPRKEYQGVTNDPDKGNAEYLSQPAEINARFVQVLHDLVPVIKRAAQLDPAKGKQLVDRSFQKLLDNHQISILFPERTASKDYKRLIKRGVDFIAKELAYAKSEVEKQK